MVDKTLVADLERFEFDGMDANKTLEVREMFARCYEELKRLNELINNPHTDDFLEAVRLEAAFQREHWGSAHDAGKTDADWFWLVGYLAGKALSKPEKRLHHTVSTAAALMNWHAQAAGVRNEMRPGIGPDAQPPKPPAPTEQTT